MISTPTDRWSQGTRTSTPLHLAHSLHTTICFRNRTSRLGSQPAILPITSSPRFKKQAACLQKGRNLAFELAPPVPLTYFLQPYLYLLTHPLSPLAVNPRFTTTFNLRPTHSFKPLLVRQPSPPRLHPKAWLSTDAPTVQQDSKFSVILPIHPHALSPLPPVRPPAGG